MQKQYLTLAIVVSALSFPVSGMEKKVTKQERQIIDWTQALALKHSDDFYDLLATKQQEKVILSEVNRTAKKHKVESKPFFKKASGPRCSIF